MVLAQLLSALGVGVGDGLVVRVGRLSQDRRRRQSEHALGRVLALALLRRRRRRRPAGS